MNMFKLVKQALVITGALAVMAFPAWAGSGQDPGENVPDSVIGMDDIVVTAEKQKQNVQDVPASISAFSEYQIEDAGMENTLDLVRLSPNLHMQENYLEHIVVSRGISSFNTSLYSPMGFYVDDVGYPLHMMHNPDFFDIERIEVLRGPQGTLYGRNSESGVINIITKPPGNTFNGAVMGEFAEDNSYRAGLKLSGPVKKDCLFMGMSVLSDVSDGHVDNLTSEDDQADDHDALNGRFSLRWTPSDPWDISFIASAMTLDAGIAGYRWIDGPQATAPYKVRHDADEYSEQDGNNQVLRVAYQGRNVTFLSVTSLLHYRHDTLSDSDLYDAASNQTYSRSIYENNQFSQEFRFSSPENGSSPFQWVAGVYGYKDETDVDYEYYVENMAFYGLSDISYMNPLTNIDGRGLAVFGQGTYTLFDRLHLTAGLRYDYQRLEGAITGQYLDMMSFSQADYNLKDTLETKELLPKFAVAYDLVEGIMTYATASKGFISGGFNYCNTPSDLTLTYDSEYTWNYEAGIKTMWFDNRLMANLALFYIDIKDKQVAQVDGTTLTTAIGNAAQAHSAGAELDLKFRPCRALELFAAAGYTEAKFDEFTATELASDGFTLVRNDYGGNYLPYAPKFTFNLGAQYRHPKGFFCRLDYFVTDTFYGDYANAAEQSAYQTVNLRMGYESEHFDCVLWVRNLFDEEYLTYLTSYSQYNMGLDGDPRTVGITLKYRF